MWKNRSSRFAAPRISILLTAVSGWIFFGCTGLTVPSAQSAVQEKQSSNRQALLTVKEVSQTREPHPNRERESSSSPPITEGFYRVGRTDSSLEVSGGRFRYADEEGKQEWQDLAGLTAVKEGVIFDGKSYWCLSQLDPKDAVAACTADGWDSRIVNAEEKPREISTEELSVGGIRLGDDEATVRRKLGAPRRISKYPVDGTYFEYDGLEFALSRGGAFDITSTSDRYCTPAGVCPGMPLSEIRKIYGVSEIYDLGEEGRFVEYYGPPGLTCWLKIALDSQDRAKSVGVACQP